MGISVCQTPLPTQERRWYNTHRLIIHQQLCNLVKVWSYQFMNITTSDMKGGKGWISEDVGYKSRFTDIICKL